MDLTKKFWDKYTQLDNKNIEILLKNYETITGCIVGFYRGDDNKPFITRWHVITQVQKLMNEDTFGNPEGEIIDHKNIVEIKFLQDNSIMRFI